jgi:hypothetical protein
MSDTLEKPKMGRPTTYTVEVGEKIATLYANGMKMLDILKHDWAPANFETVTEWQDRAADFAALMARARAARSEFLVDTMEDAIKDHPDPQKARLAIQVRQWQASKWSPRYADRIAVEVDHKVSIGAALEAGLSRVALPMRDQRDAKNSQAIEDAAYSVVDTTHQRSGDTDEEPDWMS